MKIKETKQDSWNYVDQKPCIVKLKYNVHVKNQKIFFIIGRTLVTKIQQEQDD